MDIGDEEIKWLQEKYPFPPNLSSWYVILKVKLNRTVEHPYVVSGSVMASDSHEAEELAVESLLAENPNVTDETEVSVISVEKR